MKPTKAKHGFTLIEIILALMVIAIGVMAAIGLLGTSLDTTTKTHDDINLVSFADMVFNYYHAADSWSDIPPDGSWQIPDYGGGRHDLRTGQFTCTTPGFLGADRENYTVSYQLDAVHDGNVKALTLRVWPGYSTNGPPRSFYTEIYNWKKTP